jgi:hypothetical protein
MTYAPVVFVNCLFYILLMCMTGINQVTDVILTCTWFTNVCTVETISVTTDLCIAIQYYLESICKISINLLLYKQFVATPVTDTELENPSQYSDQTIIWTKLVRFSAENCV